jgi:hypothetical protein
MFFVLPLQDFFNFGCWKTRVIFLLSIQVWCSHNIISNHPQEELDNFWWLDVGNLLSKYVDFKKTILWDLATSVQFFHKILVYELHYFFSFVFFLLLGQERKWLIETPKKICIFKILTLDFSFWHNFGINNFLNFFFGIASMLQMLLWVFVQLPPSIGRDRKCGDDL